MLEQAEAKQAIQAEVKVAAPTKESAETFLDELAKDRRALSKMAANSNDGYPCYIYRTKADCEWHPPCHWAGANCQ